MKHLPSPYILLGDIGLKTYQHFDKVKSISLDQNSQHISARVIKKAETYMFIDYSESEYANILYAETMLGETPWESKISNALSFSAIAATCKALNRKKSMKTTFCLNHLQIGTNH